MTFPEVKIPLPKIKNPLAVDPIGLNIAKSFEHLSDEDFVLVYDQLTPESKAHYDEYVRNVLRRRAVARLTLVGGVLGLACGAVAVLSHGDDGEDAEIEDEELDDEEDQDDTSE